MKVVIVDDDPAMLDMVTITVKKKFPEYEVAAYSRPEDARNGYAVDKLLTDYNLHASINGLDLIKEYQANSPKTHCILMSGGDDIGEAEKYTKELGIDFLQKPFDMTKLFEILSKSYEKVGVNDGSNI